MLVFMLMLLREMQPDTKAHQHIGSFLRSSWPWFSILLGEFSIASVFLRSGRYLR